MVLSRLPDLKNGADCVIVLGVYVLIQTLKGMTPMERQYPAPKVGLRNFKTALSASLCALLYFFIDRNPTFACIGAVFGMGANMEHSRLLGGNRLFGTILGGFLGIALFGIYLHFFPDGESRFLLIPFLFIGIIVLIVLSQVFWVGAVQPGSVVLCIILFSTPVDTYISYSLNRMADTAVGVLISLLINYLLPRERLIRWLEKLKLRRPEETAAEIPSENETTETAVVQSETEE